MNGDSGMPAGDFFVQRQDNYQGPTRLGSPAHLAAIGRDYSIPFALIKLVVLSIVPFILVDAAIYHLQMFVTGGATPITPAVLKMGLLGAFAAAFLLRGKINNPAVVTVALLFIAYLILAALHQYFDLGIEFVDILLGYNAYYLLPLIGVIALSTPVKISERLLVVVSIILSLICGGLGIAQYLTNSPIVATSSSDGYFRVMVWGHMGHIRVFSLFVAPAACGAFFCFIASLAVAMCRRKSNLVIAIPLLALSLFVSWASGARTTIVCTVCGVATSWIISFAGKKDRTKWLPFIWLAGGIIVACYAYSRIGGGGLSTGLVTDASSFASRFATWSNILDMFRSSSVFNLLLGYGLVQGQKLDPTGTGGSDNLYLALILHIGVLGLGLMMFLFWHLWQAVRKEAETRRSYLTTAVAATYSTLLMAGLFDLSTFGMFFLLFAISE